MRSKKIRIKTKDLITGIECVCTFTREQAQKIMKAAINELISLGKEGAWIWVRSTEIAITFGYGGDKAFLEKSIVLNQIEEQLGL
ncbi:MAG: hypothetical protein H6Q52_129 [Deltaproteobacteria bacterium]|nr:hypothetical protein [Deltaproteobacteria bacterium]